MTAWQLRGFRLAGVEPDGFKPAPVDDISGRKANVINELRCIHTEILSYWADWRFTLSRDTARSLISWSKLSEIGVRGSPPLFCHVRDGRAVDHRQPTSTNRGDMAA